jgi:hypothetical protein
MEIHEVFTDLGRKNDGESRAKVLLDNDSLALRTLMRLNYDKTIKLNLSDEIEYKPAPLHEVYTTINKETKNYVKLISPSLSRDKADNLFISMLESLDPREAKILNAAKNKKLFVRGLSRKLAVKVWGNRIFS